MDYETKSHCKYLIALHLILVVKYRKQLLVGELGQFLKAAIKQLSMESDFDIEEIEIDKDHVHILMTISPKYSISQHVRNIKQLTTHKIWCYSPNLKKQFWKERTFWSDGYFVCSVGNASAETIRRYIQEQG
jgi:putative transposase